MHVGTERSSLSSLTFSPQLQQLSFHWSNTQQLCFVSATSLAMTLQLELLLSIFPTSPSSVLREVSSPHLLLPPQIAVATICRSVLAPSCSFYFASFPCSFSSSNCSPLSSSLLCSHFFTHFVSLTRLLCLLWMQLQQLACSARAPDCSSSFTSLLRSFLSSSSLSLAPSSQPPA